MLTKKIYLSLSCLCFISTTLLSDSSNINVKEVFKQECQKCHGINHEGGKGANLTQDELIKKDTYELEQIILNGIANSAMPSYKDKFSKADISKMVDYLQNFKGQPMDILNLNIVRKNWKILNRRKYFKEQFPYSFDTKVNTDICFITEKDAQRVTFLNGTNGEILSKQPAGFNVHISISNKKFPRYAYTISRSGLVTMFDINTPGQQKIAQVKIGSNSRALAVSNDGKYLLAGNYEPAGAVLMNAMTLEPLKIYSTSNIDDIGDTTTSSRISSIYSTPYKPYFAMNLKDVGHIFIIDYSKKDFPIIADITNAGKNLEDGFLNGGKEKGRYLFLASSGSDTISMIDFKTKSIKKKIYTGLRAKPHTGYGASWYNKNLKTQLNATSNMNLNEVTIWDENLNIVKKVKVSSASYSISTSKSSPYLWVDNILGGKNNWNKIDLIDKETLEVVKTIKVGIDKGELIDYKTKKVLNSWKVETVTDSKNNILIPKIFNAEAINHGKWTMVSETNCNRIAIYDSKTAVFIKYIKGLKTPTFNYCVEQKITF